MGSHAVGRTAGLERDDGRDSDRRAASRRGNLHQFPLPVSRIGKTGAEIFGCEIGEVCENFLLAHSGGKILQYIVHGHAKVMDAGLPPRFSGSMVMLFFQAIRRRVAWETANSNAAIGSPHCVQAYSRPTLSQRNASASTTEGLTQSRSP